MTTSFLSQDIWPQLTKSVRGSRQGCSVAVAYFGKGASHLLPLAKGSRLVVDASEGSVASGQTCPADLVRLVNRGVAVYSVPNLHAKVFVLGRTAYIGSVNVSNRSASTLVEAVIRTTEGNAVRAAREFVQRHCLHRLTPKILEQLAKLYRPPRVPGGKRSAKRPSMTSKRPTLPRLLLAQLDIVKLSERDQAMHDAGLAVAQKRREHPRSFELDDFRWTGRCAFQRGDVVIQVTDEGSNKVLVSPPGNVRYVRKWRDGNKRKSFVYVERPVQRRRQLKSLARALGCPQKKMRSDGVVRDLSFAQALLNTWAVTK